MQSNESSKTFRVVVADDHPVVAGGVEVLLATRPDVIVCGRAASGEELEELLKEARADLLILDLGLGSTHGLEILRRVTGLDSRLKVVIFSMYSDPGIIQAAMRAGASAYVCKQDSPSNLLSAVASVLYGKRWLGLENGDASGHPSQRSPIESLLTSREIGIFEMFGDGLKTREIASRLFVSVKTIESHRENIKSKLMLASAEQLIASAARWNAGRRGFQIPA